jgi:hypothetical protein
MVDSKRTYRRRFAASLEKGVRITCEQAIREGSKTPFANKKCHARPSVGIECGRLDE